MRGDRVEVNLEGHRANGRLYIEVNSLLAALYKLNLRKFAEGIEDFRKIWDAPP